jgi:histidine kinase family protein
MRNLSLQLKLFVVVAILCLAASFSAARISTRVFERRVEDSALQSLRSAANALDARERSEIEKLASTLDALLANDELREAFVARDREKLLTAAAPLFETMRERDRITHWYFIAPTDRTVFLRVHAPALHGDRVDRITLRRAIETGDLGAGKELGLTAFALRAVRPWYHQGRLIGYMELAEEIDHFLTTMKSRTGDEYGLLVQKRYLDEQAWAKVLGPRANTWNDRADVVVVDTTTFTDGIIDFDGNLDALPDGGSFSGEIERGDRAFVRGVFPVRDAAGRKVGGLFVLHDFTAEHAAMRTGAVETAFALLACGAVLALAIGLATRRLVFARLVRLRTRLEAEATRERLPPGRVVNLSDDEIAGLEALLDRALFPARYRDVAPPPAGDEGGDATKSHVGP